MCGIFPNPVVSIDQLTNLKNLSMNISVQRMYEMIICLDKNAVSSLLSLYTVHSNFDGDFRG